MRALVVYESMFGSTRLLADAIAEVLERSGTFTVLTTAADAPRSAAGFDLVVVGAPTHARTLPQPASRIEAAAWAADPRRALRLEPYAHDRGVREWLAGLQIPDAPTRFAAFSTRVDIARILAGDAAVSISRSLRGLGVGGIEQECFLVSSSGALLFGEKLRAEQWADRMLAGLRVRAGGSRGPAAAVS